MESTLTVPEFLRKTAGVCFFAACLSACQQSPAPVITEIRAYQAPASLGVAALIRHHGLSSAKTGYLLYDLDTGEKLAARNEHQLFIPASTAKVPATLAALNILGPDYRFHTRLLATGELDKASGILKGDLYLQGGGAPLLQVADLMNLAGRLKDLGVSKVTGRFNFDQSLLHHAPSIEPGQPDNARYNPGISALSLDFNQTLLTWRKPGRQTGEPGVVEAFETPATGNPPSGLAPGNPGAGQNVVPGDKDGKWLLSPSAPKAGEEYLPVKPPPRGPPAFFVAWRR